MSDSTRTGWKLLRVGAARLPEILYTCEACGCVTYFPIGSFTGNPDPKCCAAYRAWPEGKKVFDEFLTARPLCAEKEAEAIGVNVALSSMRPQRSIIMLVASHRGRKRKKS